MCLEFKWPALQKQFASKNNAPVKNLEYELPLEKIRASNHGLTPKYQPREFSFGIHEQTNL